jgi:hypothetical protein
MTDAAKTAKSLGITVPPGVPATVDKLIKSVTDRL